MPPVKISGRKYSRKLARRSRAQRNWRFQTSAALRRPSGCASGRSTSRTLRPAPRTILVAAASSATSLAERLDAAGGVEIGAPPQHGFALREAEAERVDDILPARLIGVEERAFDLGPNPVRPAADRRRGDKPGIVAPAREQPLDVIARHQHIAVGDDDPVVARGAPALEDVIELGIRAHAVVADEQPAPVGTHCPPSMS